LARLGSFGHTFIFFSLFSYSLALWLTEDLPSLLLELQRWYVSDLMSNVECQLPFAFSSFIFSSYVVSAYICAFFVSLFQVGIRIERIVDTIAI
jgi:hypothetical protein